MLSYTVTGPSAAPPLVFFHGFLGCKEDWEATLAFLKTEFLCFAFDLPGHGTSPIDAKIEETLTALNLKQAPLIGYSMGGRVALSLKTNAPCILIASHPGLATEKEKALRWKNDLKWAQALTTIPFEIFLNQWYSQPLFSSVKQRPELYLEMLKRRKKQNPHHLAHALKRFSLAKQSRVKEFSSPTLYLFGTEDLKFSRLSHTLPSSVSIQSIQGCGHVTLYENPKELAKNMHTFLLRHSLREE